MSGNDANSVASLYSFAREDIFSLSRVKPVDIEYSGRQEEGDSVLASHLTLLLGPSSEIHGQVDSSPIFSPESIFPTDGMTRWTASVLTKLPQKA